MSMRSIILAALCSVCVGAVPALAIDCHHASSRVEKIICGDAELKAADAALSAAYFKLLRSTKDKEIHDLLVYSQRRWLKARDDRFWTAPEADTDNEGKDNEKVLALRGIEDRLENLTRPAGPQGHPFPVEQIERERREVSQYTGGPYAGYETTCFFGLLRFDNGSYICIGRQTFQNNDRVCSSTTDWASTHLTEYRTVAVVVGDHLKTVATCATGYAPTDEPCPDSGYKSAGEHWNTNAVVPSGEPGIENRNHHLLLKYDPEGQSMTVMAGGNDSWLHACLTDKSYPRANSTKRPAP